MKISHILTAISSKMTRKPGAALVMGLLLGAISAQAEPPVADVGGPYINVEVGIPFTFDGSGSYDPDPDGSIDQYNWNFGDFTLGEGEMPSHTYLDVRQFTDDPHQGTTRSDVYEITATGRG